MIPRVDSYVELVDSMRLLGWVIAVSDVERQTEQVTRVFIIVDVVFKEHLKERMRTLVREITNALSKWD